MISEVENITKGLVVSTVQFDTSKKIIGVSTANLQPGPDGIAPLEKQGAFQPAPQAETVDFAQALSQVQTAEQSPTEETVVLPVIGDESNKEPLKEPVSSDVISENPIQVESPAALTGFELPNIEVPDTPVEEAPLEPIALDITLPEMPETVVADEPATLDENLFEGANPTQESILTTETQPNLTTDVQPEIAASENPSEVATELQPETPATTVEETVQSQTTTPEVLVDNNVMSEIPTTNPSESIPEFSIEMPILGTEETKLQEEATVEPTAKEIPAQTVAEELSPVEGLTQPEPTTVVETSEPLPQTAESETPTDALEEFKNIMSKYAIDLSERLAGVAAVLKEAAQDIENIKIKKPDKVEEQIQEVTAKVMQTANQGNELVVDAFDRINAIGESGPRL